MDKLVFDSWWKGINLSTFIKKQGSRHYFL